MQRNLLDGLEFFHEYRDQRKANAFPTNSFSPTHQGILTMANQNAAKDQYEELLKHYNTYSPLAKNVGESILSKLLKSSENPAALEIYAKLKDAAGRNDFEAVSEYHSQLKAIKDNEKTHSKSLSELRKNADWDAIQKAFRPEFEAMAYEAALEALKATHNAIQNSKTEGKTRKPRTPKAEGSAAKEDGLPAAPKVAKGVYSIKTKNGSHKIETGKTGRVKWDDYSALLEDLGIEYSRNDKDVISFKNEGLKVSQDSDSLYKPSFAAIIGGVKNGLYAGATIESEPKAE